MQTTGLAQLPVGLQAFAKVREGNFAYVDKTRQALALANSTGAYFLSRPRRFGKSLFLDTLRNLFEGRVELFRGLYAEANWNWEVQYPVIKLDMSGGSISIDALRSTIEGNLLRAAKRLGIELAVPNEPNELFQQLIYDAYVQYGRKVVLLVDEYDKPMTDNIDDIELAQQMCKQLRSVYSIIKISDEYLRFVMLTGVSKFSKVSIFSGLNNLEDISLEPRYGSICGYTEDELNEVFSGHLRGVDREQLRQWYNGYNFLGTSRVYNPHDILNFIKRSQSFGEPHFDNYWFQTGTPTFVIDLLKRDRVLPQQLEPQSVGSAMLDSCPIEHVELTTVLFQSGYLTIDSVNTGDPHAITYKLKCPNNSVRVALQSHLFRYYTRSADASYQNNVYCALRDTELDIVGSELKRLFASIAADNYRKNNIAHFEGYYASVVYCFFAGMGLTVTAEDVNNLGRIDLTVQLAGNTYIVEFKVVKRKSKTNSALQQIIRQDYAAKYSGTVYQIGIELSEAKRNIVAFDWQRASS